MNAPFFLHRKASLLLCFIILAFSAQPAFAQVAGFAADTDAAQPGRTPVLSVLPASGMPGQPLIVIAGGLPPGDAGSLHIGQEGGPFSQVASFTVDEQGRIRLAAVIPSEAVPRQVWVVELRSGSAVLANRLTVTSRPTLYFAREGDTLEQVAAAFGLRSASLIRVNPELSHDKPLAAGQALIIPTPRRDDRPGSLSPAPSMRQAVFHPGVSSYPGHWVDVDLTLQRAYAYDGETLVRAFTVSTGVRRHPTLTGEYKVYRRHEKTTMSGEGYYLRNVPYTMYYDRGYALHGTYWHSNFGTPMSHGCVNFSVEDSAWLFGFAPIGTLVNIHN